MRKEDGLIIQQESKCPKCGKIFYIWDRDIWAYKAYVPEGHRSVPTFYCSWSCMRSAEKERKKKCARCGKPLSAEETGKYCEMCETMVFIETQRERIRKEKDEAKRATAEEKLQRRADRVCPVCGKKIPIYSRTFKYCSEECRRKATFDAQNKKHREKCLQKKMEAGQKKCLYCGKPIPIEAPSNRKYCSKRCGMFYNYYHVEKPKRQKGKKKQKKDEKEERKNF